MDSQIPDAAYASQPPIVKTRLASRSTASWHYGRPSCAWWSTSLYVFGNTAGQVYTRSGWNTSWSRLMDYCEIEAKARHRARTLLAARHAAGCCYRP
ncbi:hypothetical protein PQR66_03000 [Paraburkholderia agricolaris]|uniref:Uncharacterized protein n=1 Tax=Paraburkholderia agricolaris TaxID=2152888 RepID=A0ABW8ZFK8_9BURK